MKIKLAIAIPNTGVIKAQTVFCLVRALKDFPYDYTVFFKEGSILHSMREELAQKSLDLGCTHLLFIDSDMFFEKDAIIKLIKRNKDIIGVNYNRRKINGGSTVSNPIKKNGLSKCEAVATGFMLIKTDVFRAMEHQWFFWESDKQGKILTGEDYWFCRKAKEMGYNIYVDFTLDIKHIGDYLY